jgi:predicted metal-dependent hydrolase
MKFTCEIEKEGVLPYLDVEVKRTENNQLQFKVFQLSKPTNTQRFIVNESHHSRQHKMVAFNSMMHRAVNIPMNDEDQRAAK